MIYPLQLENLETLISSIKEVIIQMDCQHIYQGDEECPSREITQQNIENNEAYGCPEQGEILTYIVLNEDYGPEYETVDCKIQDRFLVYTDCL